MSNDTSTLEVLAFRLGQEEYGVDILTVQEIRGHDALTRIAGAPGFIQGVINLRGTIVPIVDLRPHFGIDEGSLGHATAVIILGLAGSTFGMVVDSVSDVVRIGPGDIRPAPETGGNF